jgi:hypothetical protein
MRGNLPVPSHALPRLRRGGPRGRAALFPAEVIFEMFTPGHAVVNKVDKVATGINPVALAARRGES